MLLFSKLLNLNDFDLIRFYNFQCFICNIFLILAEPLIFMSPPEDVELSTTGVKAVFECEVSKSGLKPEWLQSGKPISRSAKYEITSSNGKHTLVVDDCQAKDVGGYTVQLATASATAQLTIKG